MNTFWFAFLFEVVRFSNIQGPITWVLMSAPESSTFGVQNLFYLLFYFFYLTYFITDTEAYVKALLLSEISLRAGSPLSHTH